MLFNVRGIVHSKFLPQGQMINQQDYMEILWLLLGSVCKKRGEFRQEKFYLLHHNTAPVLQCPEHLAVTGREEGCHAGRPLYLPDLALCDFFLFPSSKGLLRGPVLKA